MLTGQNYDAPASDTNDVEPTAQNSLPTVNSGHNPPTTTDERPVPVDEEWHRQQVDKATAALVVTVNSFFDLKYEELTPVRVMGNLLKHWLTTEYKERIREVKEEDWEISYLDNHLSAMLDTIGFLSLLECQQRVMELFERDLRSTQTGLV